jgi:general secretion pathway protein K
MSAHAQRGAALLYVLLIVAVLTTVVVESMRLMQVDAVNSRIVLKQAQARQAAESGMAFICQELFADAADSDADHYGEDWRTALGDATVPGVDLGEAVAWGELADESAKFPINSLLGQDSPSVQAQAAFKRLLTSESLQVDEELADRIIAAMLDWLDTDAKARSPEGAEQHYYLGMQTPYSSRNGPFESISELALVRHITPELLWGEEGRPGLADLVSVHTVRVNINTASSAVLQALIDPATGVTPQAMAEDMVAFRSQEMNFDYLEDPNWYRTVMSGYSDIVLPPEIASVRCDAFSLHLTARAGLVHKRLYAVLERTEPDTQPGQDAGQPSTPSVKAVYLQMM